ncbi:C16orf58 [Bugula neritina]|uniref:C16orf58 n=1 Tax=Bugula neritina TaxID=10212 RepID=A0A7J7K7R0_BUGNE|nr:C16orf58 [Bugula neritina]
MNGAVVITERYGSSNRKRDYVSTGSDTLRVLEQENERFQSIGQMFETVFLPQGYPESVSSDYLKYQIYDTIQVGTFFYLFMEHLANT